MRFLFQGGGRSGIRSAEDLGHALEAYCNDNRHLQDMLVDFSGTYDQIGELFRLKCDLLHEITMALQELRENKSSILNGPNLPAMWQHLGAKYWAEAEAKLLSKVAKPRRKKQVLRRETL